MRGFFDGELLDQAKSFLTQLRRLYYFQPQGGAITALTVNTNLHKLLSRVAEEDRDDLGPDVALEDGKLLFRGKIEVVDGGPVDLRRYWGGMYLVRG